MALSILDYWDDPFEPARKLEADWKERLSRLSRTTEHEGGVPRIKPESAHAAPDEQPASE